MKTYYELKQLSHLDNVYIIYVFILECEIFIVINILLFTNSIHFLGSSIALQNVSRSAYPEKKQLKFKTEANFI